MRKTFFTILAFSFLLISVLAGCILVPEDGRRRGGDFERDGHHEEHHEHFEERR